MENGKEPAFPFVGSHSDESPEVMIPLSLGITKREYFAGLAMQGLFTAMHSDRIMHLAACADAKEQQSTDTPDMEKYCAGYAVKMADELLKALEG